MPDLIGFTVDAYVSAGGALIIGIIVAILFTAILYAINGGYPRM